ncbi:MAG: TraM recognition domain-containing protein [Verrucomicrobiota bacterium]
MFGKKSNDSTELVPSEGKDRSPENRDWPDDDAKLVTFGPNPKLAENDFCLSHAFTGVQVFGATGSGKTTASINCLARSYLKAGMGGLVLTAKTDELDNWIKLAEETGRLDDLISFSPNNDYRFNFMRYEFERPGTGAGQTENLVNLFTSVLEVAERRGSGQSGNDPYWQRTLKQLLRNAIDLSIIAADTVDLAIIHKIITSAPKKADQLANEEWKANSVCMKLLAAAEAKEKSPAQKADLDLVIDYWLEEYPSLADETRSSIVSTFTSMADCFLRGTLRELFCTDLNISPEDSFEGKIITLNLPVKEWNELGQFAQVLFKFIWQRAVERRIPQGMDWEERQEQIRPLFLCADESHFFANSYDAQFQSTARSSRCCTIYATQNLPSYISAFGGMQGKIESEAFIGNLQTKIFHANGDPTTNQWAADSISRTHQAQLYGGKSEGFAMSGASGSNINAGASMVMQHSVPPYEFTLLRTGGPDYDSKVDAVIFQAGRSWLVDGQSKNFIRHCFDQ